MLWLWFVRAGPVPVHLLGKTGKEQVGIVGARAGFRVILHTKNGLVGEPQPFYCAVIEVAVVISAFGGNVASSTA